MKYVDLESPVFGGLYSFKNARTYTLVLIRAKKIKLKNTMKYAPPAGIEPVHTRLQCRPLLSRMGYKTPASVFKKNGDYESKK